MSHYSNRPRSSRADELLNKVIPVLEGQAHLILVDYIGSDASVARGARCSYGESNKTFREDERLIRFLMRHAHTSPFEQVSFLIHLRLPIFLSYEFTRCRSSKSQIFWPKGELEFWFPNGIKKERLNVFYEEVRSLLRKEKNIEENPKIALSFAPGTSLIDLVWQIDLHNLCYFIRSRRENSSSEFGEFLRVLILFLEAVAPCSFSAFMDYVMNGELLDKKESQKISKSISSLSMEKIEEEASAIGMVSGEIKEFMNKFFVSSESL